MTELIVKSRKYNQQVGRGATSPHKIPLPPLYPLTGGSDALVSREPQSGQHGRRQHNGGQHTVDGSAHVAKPARAQTHAITLNSKNSQIRTHAFMLKKYKNSYQCIHTHYRRVYIHTQKNTYIYIHTWDCSIGICTGPHTHSRTR